MDQPFSDLDYGLSSLAALFHQDWMLDGDHTATLDIVLWPEQSPSAVLALRDDATVVGNLANDEIEHLWVVATDEYFVFNAGTGSGAEWIESVIDRCDGWLRAHGLDPAGRLARPPGPVFRGAVVPVVNAIIDAHVEDGHLLLARPGLIKCSELGADNLALRLLVRIAAARVLSLTHDQYAQLDALGRQLGCGEFVVSAVEYLVT